MPDDGGGAEADSVARILEPPAHVDVVAGAGVDLLRAQRAPGFAEHAQHAHGVATWRAARSQHHGG